MPIYEYQCQSCNHIHEVLQRISEDPLTVCPDCQGTLKKMVSRSAFHLKGGGWYADGYSSSGECGKATGGNGGGNGSNGGSTGSDKADSSATPAASPAKAPAADKPSCAKGGGCCAANK